MHVCPQTTLSGSAWPAQAVSNPVLLFICGLFFATHACALGVHVLEGHPVLGDEEEEVGPSEGDKEDEM